MSGPIRSRRDRSDAGAATAFAHLLPAQVLRLPDQADQRHDRQTRLDTKHENRHQLYRDAHAVPIKDEKNLEEFFINRFGRELYRTFFKSYTEKVWGVPCNEISAEWGAQRIKGLSIMKAMQSFFRQAFGSKNDIAQKETETSLIEQFLYPKLGPGQMWELVADKVRALRRHDHHGCRRDQAGYAKARVALASACAMAKANATLRGRLFFLDHAGERIDPHARLPGTRRMCGR